MLLSVIIPCFNDGHFLPDAVNSVLDLTEKDIEIIIVNDGSTDPCTLDLLYRYQCQGIMVLSHDNGGLGYSRNKGIAASTGKYILPLDADNKITADYIKKAIVLLESDQYDIVYADPIFFGEDIEEKKFYPHDFVGYELFFYNYIDACTIFRKSTWESVGGFDENMPYQGNEDWEFWLRCYLNGYRFKYINEGSFFYRISKVSMVSELMYQKGKANHDHIILKHKDEFLKHAHRSYSDSEFYRNDQKNYLRTSVKYLVKFAKKMLKL